MAFGKKKQPPIDPIAIAQAQRVREEQEVQAAFQKGITALRDFIAPSSMEFGAPTSSLAPATPVPTTSTVIPGKYTRAG
jgi:hypothetical protein